MSAVVVGRFKYEVRSADHSRMHPDRKKSLAYIYSFQLRLMLAFCVVVALGLLIMFTIGDPSAGGSTEHLQH